MLWCWWCCRCCFCCCYCCCWCTTLHFRSVTSLRVVPHTHTNCTHTYTLHTYTLNARARTHARTHAHTHTHARTHARTHTRTHARTHAHTNSDTHSSSTHQRQIARALVLYAQSTISSLRLVNHEGHIWATQTLSKNKNKFTIGTTFQRLTTSKTREREGGREREREREGEGGREQHTITERERRVSHHKPVGEVTRDQ